MARVTSDDVLAIMDVTATEADKAKIEAMIIAASAVIDKAFENDTSMTETLLTECERWLTAHMVSLTIFRSTSKEKIGDVELTFTGKWGEKLNATPYGQTLLLLDTSGVLAQAGKEGIDTYAIPNFED